MEHTTNLKFLDIKTGTIELAWACFSSSCAQRRVAHSTQYTFAESVEFKNSSFSLHKLEYVQRIPTFKIVFGIRTFWAHNRWMHVRIRCTWSWKSFIFKSKHSLKLPWNICEKNVSFPQQTYRLVLIRTYDVTNWIFYFMVRDLQEAPYVSQLRWILQMHWMSPIILGSDKLARNPRFSIGRLPCILHLAFTKLLTLSPVLVSGIASQILFCFDFCFCSRFRNYFPRSVSMKGWKKTRISSRVNARAAWVWNTRTKRARKSAIDTKCVIRVYVY